MKKKFLSPTLAAFTLFTVSNIALANEFQAPNKSYEHRYF